MDNDTQLQPTSHKVFRFSSSVDMHILHTNTFISGTENLSLSWAVWWLDIPVVLILVYNCLNRFRHQEIVPKDEPDSCPQVTNHFNSEALLLNILVLLYNDNTKYFLFYFYFFQFSPWYLGWFVLTMPHKEAVCLRGTLKYYHRGTLKYYHRGTLQLTQLTSINLLEASKAMMSSPGLSQTVLRHSTLNVCKLLTFKKVTKKISHYSSI